MRPLAAAVAFAYARDFVSALATRTPTMDLQPMLCLTDVLIRRPGSVHGSGGQQRLRGTLAAAYDIAQRRNPPVVWAALQQALAGEIAAVPGAAHRHRPGRR